MSDQTFLNLTGSAVSTFEHCGECTKLHLTSQGSFAEDYSRFIGTWVKVSTYMDLPMYQCMDCGGLTQHLVQLKTLFIVLLSLQNESLTCRYFTGQILTITHKLVGGLWLTATPIMSTRVQEVKHNQEYLLLNWGSILTNLKLKQFLFSKTGEKLVSEQIVQCLYFKGSLFHDHWPVVAKQILQV